MTGYSTIFGGSTIYPSNLTYLNLSLSANTQLYWPIEAAAGQNVVSDLIDVTPSGSFAILMPDATKGSTGINTFINNLSGSTAFTVQDSTGATILSVAAGTVWILYLVDNSTAAGTWRSYQFGAQIGSVNVAAIAGSGLTAIGSSLNQSMPIIAINTNYTSTSADLASVLLWSGAAGTITLPAAGTAGSNWFVNIRNSGTGDISVAPPSGTIDGAASKTFTAGSSSAIVVTDGTNYYTIGFGSSGATGGFDYTTIDVSGTGDFTIAGAQLNRISYKLTGTLTGNRNFVVPASVQQYWVNNATSGAFTLTVKTPAGTGQLITQGQQNIVYCDGTNVVPAVSAISLPVAIASGGTGATTAAAARTNLGGTATGVSLFTAASAAAARTTLGSTTVGDAIFIAASASAALTAMAGGTLTGAVTVTTTVTGGSFIPTSSTVPTNGMYLSAANTVNFATATTSRVSISSAGLLTASFGLTVTGGAITLSPASFNVVLSPTGTGAVTINPATLGTMNNMNIGGSTRGTGAFTTLTANSTCTLTNGVTVSGGNFVSRGISDSATAVSLTLSSTGAVTIGPASGIAVTLNGITGSQALVANGGASTPVNAIGNSGTAFTMDCSQSNVHTVTMTGNVAAGSLTISNIADGQTVNLRCTQDATGGRTLGNPTSVKWPGGVPSPILSTAANAVDIIVFSRISGVTYASVQQAFA